jgi:hypothetical protein
LRRQQLPREVWLDVVIHPRAGSGIPETGELKEEIQRLLTALNLQRPSTRA